MKLGHPWFARLAWTAAATTLLAACGREEQVEDLPRPSVLWICIDTLRADHLGCYGYELPTSPRIDQMARRGTLFEQAFSQSSWTKPSIPSFFSSRYPADHQVYEGSSKDNAGRVFSDLFSLDELTAAELFSGAGYTTGGFVHNSHLRGFLGFDQGFDTYLDESRRAAAINADCLEWIETLGDEPFFAYVHYLDVHWPYRAAEVHRAAFPSATPTLDLSGSDAGSLRSRINAGQLQPSTTDVEAMVALYDACIHENDEAMGALLDRLDALGRLENTYVVITSDHGEEFMEHGKIGHGQSLRDSLIHIPLLISGPGIPASGVNRNLAEAIDVLPTLLGLVGLPVPSPLQGFDFADALQGKADPTPREHVFSEVLHGRTYQRAVRTPKFKLIETYRALQGPSKLDSEDESFLRPGMRIEVKGEFDGEDFLAEEFSVEDSLDEDTEVRGQIQELSREAREFQIGRILVRMADDCQVISRTGGHKIDFESLREGDVVDVDGEAERPGVLVADKLERREDKRGAKIKIEALIDRVDPQSREIELLGLEVEFEDTVTVPGFSDLAAHSQRPRPPGHHLDDPEFFDRQIALYDLARDPGEVHNISAREVERCDRLAQVLRTWFRERQPSEAHSQTTLDATLLEELRAIGYVR